MYTIKSLNQLPSGLDQRSNSWQPPEALALYRKIDSQLQAILKETWQNQFQSRKYAYPALDFLMQGKVDDALNYLSYFHTLCARNLLHASHPHLMRSLRKVICYLDDIAGASIQINEARLVNQREVGFSSSTPMGTIRGYSCGVLAVHNPVTKKTALMHFDFWTDTNSIADAIRSLKTDGVQLEARFAGSQFDDDDSGVANINKQNLQIALDICKDLDVKILSAAVGKNAAANVVVYPENFQMVEATPELPEKRGLHLAHLCYAGRSKVTPLFTVFNLDKSPDNYPMLLNQHVTGRLNVLNRRMPEIQLYDDAARQKQLGNTGAVQYLQISDIALHEQNEQLNRLMEKVQQRAAVTGFQPDAFFYERTAQELGARQIYVGSGATEANAAIYKHIDRMFRDGRDGVVVNTEFPDVLTSQGRV